MRCKSIFILVFAVFLLGAVSASFSFYENGSSITTNYQVSDYLKADINISFFNESLNSTFTDSLGNSIQLGALLEKTPEYSYLFYDLTNETIISAYQLLDIGKANFAMPSQVKNFTYTLKLGEVNVFEETFNTMSNKNLTEENINKKFSELNASKDEIAKYDSYVQKILNESLNMTSIEDNLDKIKAEYANATTNEEYAEILNNLSNIKIPKYISETINTNPISFYPSRENVNLDALASLGGGDYGSNKEGYTDAIYSWNENNLKTTVAFTEIVADYESNEQVTLRIFDFEFDKSKMNGNPNIIIKNMENLRFENLPPLEEKDGYFLINLGNAGNQLIFSTTENVNFLNVPVFISPFLADLTPTTVEIPPLFKENKNSKWILFGVIVFIVLLIGVIVYVLLQRWYRRKYENYLFKNKNNLYNIMTFIQNAKKKGMGREEILKDLKKANWTREQINYALNKYEGKKIAGIIDRPFKNVVQELERNPSGLEKKPDKIDYTKV